MTATLPSESQLFSLRRSSFLKFREEAEQHNFDVPFWESVFEGHNKDARLAFLCNQGIRNLAKNPANGGCTNQGWSNTRDVESQTLTGQTGFRIAGAEIYFAHAYPDSGKDKTHKYIRMMRINFGKTSYSKTIKVNSQLRKEPSGSHTLTLLEEKTQTWLQQPNETLRLPQPGTVSGLSFNHGPNTAQSLRRAAMNICHIHGKTEEADYEFCYRRLLAHAGRILLGKMDFWGRTLQNLRTDSAHSQLPGLNDELFYLTNDLTSPHRIDRLAVWFAWDQKTAQNKFSAFIS